MLNRTLVAILLLVWPVCHAQAADVPTEPADQSVMTVHGLVQARAMVDDLPGWWGQITLQIIESGPGLKQLLVR